MMAGEDRPLQWSSRMISEATGIPRNTLDARIRQRMEMGMLMRREGHPGRTGWWWTYDEVKIIVRRVPRPSKLDTDPNDLTPEDEQLMIGLLRQRLETDGFKVKR